MATNSSSSTSSSSTGRSATDGNDLLELRDTDTSDLESAADDNGSGVDAAAKAAETTTPSGSDGLSEALKAERQKQHLEQQLELRERQMEEAASKRVAAVSAERDAAHERVQELRKERLLERAFSEAEGRTVGDGRGTFFQVFRSMLWDCFRLGNGKDGADVREPLDGQGMPLLGDDGRAMTTAEYLDQLRIHPV